jgi:hypothetical protein
MKRKDLKPAEELVLNLYNNTHENKIELEKVKRFYFDDGEATILTYSDNPDAVCGEDRAYVETPFTQETIKEYNREQYHRAIELAVQAVHDNNVSLYRWLSIQEVHSLREIYLSYGYLFDECIASIACKASNGLVIVDTDYEKIFCVGEYVSFKDLEGIEHKLKFAWFLSPDLKELKEYFANYKKVNRLQQIDKCKDDIERYKKWILESEETLKKLEEDEELS